MCSASEKSKSSSHSKASAASAGGASAGGAAGTGGAASGGGGGKAEKAKKDVLVKIVDGRRLLGGIDPRDSLAAAEKGSAHRIAELLSRQRHFSPLVKPEFVPSSPSDVEARLTGMCLSLCIWLCCLVLVAIHGHGSPARGSTAGRSG